MHAVHQWVLVGVERQHGVALYQFAGRGILPGVPESCQAPEVAVSPDESPPHVFAALPIGFVKGKCQDDAVLAALPRIFEAGLIRHLLGPGVVGAVFDVRSRAEPRDQAPPTYGQLFAIARVIHSAASEAPRQAREHITAAQAKLSEIHPPVLLDVAFIL